MMMMGWWHTFESLTSFFYSVTSRTCRGHISIILIAVITWNTHMRRRLHPNFCMFQVSFRRMICLHAMWHMGQDLISLENNTSSFVLIIFLFLCLHLSSFCRRCVRIPYSCYILVFFLSTELSACRFDAVIVELFPNDTK